MARSTTFMTRTRQIYRHQAERAKAFRKHLDYDLEALRQDAERQIALGCHYCGHPLTDANFSYDHALPVSKGGLFVLDNCFCVCMECNQAKGPLTAEEWMQLLDVLKQMPVESKLNVVRRLRAGGRLIRS